MFQPRSGSGAARRRQLVVRAALCLCLGGLAAGVSGQTLPLPVMPPPPPEPPAQPGTTAEPGLSSTAPPVLPQWDYLFGVGGGYNSNVFFLPGGPADNVFTSRAQISRMSRSPTGESRVEASGRAVAYLQQQQDQVAIDAALSASGRHDTGAR
ncbi:MAG TPA: hypothetical protein VEQ10_22210, partial [Vicinamibacteria bacterium]|nr:hypothetical protein [Vicinamibacteria bacterium]